MSGTLALSACDWNKTHGLLSVSSYVRASQQLLTCSLKICRV